MLSDLAAAHSYKRMLTQAVAWARLRRLAVWPLLVAAARTVRITQAEALRVMADGWLTNPNARVAPGGISRCGMASVPPWSTSGSRERAARVATDLADQVDTKNAVDRATQITVQLMANVGRSARADIQLAERHNIGLHNPFVDSRVIDAAVSVPLAERPGPASYKPILREALADLFPARLVARHTRGSFTADYYQGMRASLPALHDLADGTLAKMGLVDPRTLRQTLTAAAAGLPVAFATVEPVIAAEVWLRALHSAPGVSWTAARPVPGVA
jgi:asparagine synthase (glutamine-hydrolysing)